MGLYKINANDTANFNIELEDESYLKDLVEDIQEKVKKQEEEEMNEKPQQ